MKKEVPALIDASVVLYTNWFGKGLHLLLARPDDNKKGWKAYKQSGFSTTRLPLMHGNEFKTAMEALDKIKEVYATDGIGKPASA